MAHLTIVSGVFSGILLAVMSIALAGEDIGSFGSTSTPIEDCRTATTGLIPLSDLGAATYQSSQGGLYPGGANVMPDGHLAQGLSIAEEVVPRDELGKPSDQGQIGFVSIGVSNTLTEFAAFISLFSSDPAVSDRVEFVNGAQSGEDVDRWVETSDEAWQFLIQAVEDAGLGVNQVQAAWVKLPDRLPDRGDTRSDISFPATMLRYQEKLTAALAIARSHLPELRLVYLSSRIYGGYGSGPLGEPLSYEQGFATKWLIEDQIEEAVLRESESATTGVPWLAWGPYLWADGTTPRSDGLTWSCPDFEDDHIHPSSAGAEKVARSLFDFLRADPTSSPWFNSSGVPVVAESGTTSTGSTVETTVAPEETTTAPDTTAAPLPNDRTEQGKAGARVLAITLIFLGAIALVSALAIHWTTSRKPGS